MLELYSASGGLSFVEEAECAGGARLKTRWCCEWSKEEVETYRDNHPDCNVFHLDVEVFLRVCSKWAAMADGSFAPKKKGGKAAAAAKGAQEVVDVRGVDHRIEYLCRSPGGAERWVRDEEVADALVQAYVQANRGALPLPENVDVVMGGPPCQGVSGFNLYRHEDPLGDSKNRQTIHFTEMCLLQQPRFVIMENVVGILMFADSLVIKTSMRSFMQGGYQVRIGVCVSGTFGLPQNRARTILFAARGEEALPEYPAPTHQLPPVPISMMTTWMKKHLLNVPSAAESATLAKPLTLADAFSDLPSLKSPPARGFGSNKDNPNRAPKETKATPFRAATYGGKSSSGKPVQPLSDYQRAARERCTGKELHDHESFVLSPRCCRHLPVLRCCRHLPVLTPPLETTPLGCTAQYSKPYPQPRCLHQLCCFREAQECDARQSMLRSLSRVGPHSRCSTRTTTSASPPSQKRRSSCTDAGARGRGARGLARAPRPSPRRRASVGATCPTTDSPLRASRSCPSTRAPTAGPTPASGGSRGATSCPPSSAGATLPPASSSAPSPGLTSLLPPPPCPSLGPGPSRTTAPSSTPTRTASSRSARTRASKASPTGTASPAASTRATARSATPSRPSSPRRSAVRSSPPSRRGPEASEAPAHVVRSYVFTRARAGRVLPRFVFHLRTQRGGAWRVDAQAPPAGARIGRHACQGTLALAPGSPRACSRGRSGGLDTSPRV